MGNDGRSSPVAEGLPPKAAKRKAQAAKALVSAWHLSCCVETTESVLKPRSLCWNHGVCVETTESVLKPRSFFTPWKITCRWNPIWRFGRLISYWIWWFLASNLNFQGCIQLLLPNFHGIHVFLFVEDVKSCKVHFNSPSITWINLFCVGNKGSWFLENRTMYQLFFWLPSLLFPDSDISDFKTSEDVIGLR